MQKFLARQPLEIYLMKKSLLALAVLGAFAGAAQAQTGVTVYGSFDAGLRHQSNTTATGDSNTTMNSKGQYSSNRIGFKGVEDLGGGLNAHFTLETGFWTGSGELDNTTNQLFQRQAFVGLGGAWGAVDLGRQYSIIYQTVSAYDPFNYKYSGIIPVSVFDSNRLNNDIKYTGQFGPVKVQAEYALGEVAGRTSSKSTRAIGATYAAGPFTIGTAYAQHPDTAGTGSKLDKKDWTIGGAFATGPFRVAAGYNETKADVATGTDKTKDWWLGGSYALTPAAALTAGYYETKADRAATADGKRKLFIVGATYALSKRTNFYADIDNKRYNGTAGSLTTGKGNDSQTGVSVGLLHTF
jgi:predicted porin